MNNPSAIITSDIHIPQTTDYKPQSRTDNYWETFKRKIEFINETHNKYPNIPILDGGDLCNKYRLDPEVEAWCILNLPKGIITVAGNHEIPNHNINYLHKSSLSVLRASNVVRILYGNYCRIEAFHIRTSIYGFSYGEKIDYVVLKNKRYRSIAILHTMVYPPKEVPKTGNIKYPDGLKLLKKMKGFDLIIVGHNHQSFIIEYKERKLISPGSLMRMSIDQKDYKPRIFLWSWESNELESIDVPIKKKVLTNRYSKISKEKEEKRMNSFIEKLNSGDELEISFEKNMKNFLETNKTKKSVKGIINKIMEYKNE